MNKRYRSYLGLPVQYALPVHADRVVTVGAVHVRAPRPRQHLRHPVAPTVPDTHHPPRGSSERKRGGRPLQAEWIVRKGPYDDA